MTKPYSITPHSVIAALSSIITQAVAFGLLNAGTGQTIVAIGGIVVPSVFLLAASLHLGRVHAAQISAPAVTTANIGTVK